MGNNSNKNPRTIRLARLFIEISQWNSSASILSWDLYNHLSFSKISCHYTKQITVQLFYLEFTENYTSQVEEAFLQGADFVVPSKYSTLQVIELEQSISRVFYASWSLISLVQFIQLGMQLCIGTTYVPPKKCFKILIISIFEIVLPPPALNCFRGEGNFIAPMLFSPSINKNDHFPIDNWRIKNNNCLIAFCMEKSEGNKNSVEIHDRNVLGWKGIFYTCLHQ